MRIRAGGAGILPADISTVVGIPQLVNSSTFFQVEQTLTEKIRAEFIGRVGPRASRSRRRGCRGHRRGDVDFGAARGLHRSAAGVALPVHADDEGGVHRRPDEAGPLVNDALTFREEYELTTRSNTALEGATFLTQERSSFDRIADDVARTVVTAIVEAF